MTIRPARESDLPAVFALRFAVFVDEQHVPADIELDEEDATALHILAEEDGLAVGCARVLFHDNNTAHIGRLAVKRERRGEGIGAAICRFCMDVIASRGCVRIALHAQLHAAGFYERLGFVPHGENFFEAGIEHVEMVMPLLPPTARLSLRPVPDSDLDAMTALWLSDEIKKTYMIPDFATPDALERSVRRFLELSRMKAHFVRGIYLDDRLVGFLNDVETDGACVEIGYVIHPAAWGRGYATAALRMAIGELFEKGFSVVRAGAFEENVPSLRVMEKCGMVPTGKTESVEYRGGTHTCVYGEIHKREA